MVLVSAAIAGCTLSQLEALSPIPDTNTTTGFSRPARTACSLYEPRLMNSSLRTGSATWPTEWISWSWYRAPTATLTTATPDSRRDLIDLNIVATSARVVKGATGRTRGSIYESRIPEAEGSTGRGLEQSQRAADGSPTRRQSHSLAVRRYRVRAGQRMPGWITDVANLCGRRRIVIWESTHTMASSSPSSRTASVSAGHRANAREQT